MANVLDALKNMFVKLGGDKTKLNNNHDISDYINDIADVLKDDIEIASELPIVSTDDNGKVLGVIEGNWSKTDVPSELPTAAAADIGKVVSVVSDGESGAEYGVVSMNKSDIIINSSSYSQGQYHFTDITFDTILEYYRQNKNITVNLSGGNDDDAYVIIGYDAHNSVLLGISMLGLCYVEDDFEGGVDARVMAPFS